MGIVKSMVFSDTFSTNTASMTDVANDSLFTTHTDFTALVRVYLFVSEHIFSESIVKVKTKVSVTTVQHKMC